jgi:hypothetical protein
MKKLWKKVNKDGTHPQYFPTFEVLIEKVEHALLKFVNAPEFCRCAAYREDWPRRLTCTWAEHLFLESYRI